MKSYSDYMYEATMAARYFWVNVIGSFGFGAVTAAAIIYGVSNYGPPCAAIAAICACGAIQERAKYHQAMRRADAVKPYPKL